MIDSIIEASEGLFKRIIKINKFRSRYDVYPYKEAGQIVSEMKELAESIPDIKNPTNRVELTQAELKRRLNGDAFSLEMELTPRHYDFESVVSMFGVPESDINGLRTWLEQNRDRTLDAIERLYKTKNIQDFELGLQFDVPNVKRQAEEFAAVHIQKYHKRLGKLLQNLTQVGEFLRDIGAVPTNENRSYFNILTNTLAIGIPAICSTTEDGSLHIKERELITLYGHEGMGHALNMVVTRNNGLHYFLTENTFTTTATLESVAQFYQKVIFEDLKKSPETQKDLGIHHKFEEIYQDAKDVDQLREFQLNLFLYSITVLANKNLGNPQKPLTLKKKARLIGEVTLDPTYPLHLVEQNRYNFDSQGNLSAKLTSELRYCAKPVKRALEEFEKQGILYQGKDRSLIDAALLRGFWTPIGYVDNARLIAEERK